MTFPIDGTAISDITDSTLVYHTMPICAMQIWHQQIVHPHTLPYAYSKHKQRCVTLSCLCYMYLQYEDGYNKINELSKRDVSSFYHKH